MYSKLAEAPEVKIQWCGNDLTLLEVEAVIHFKSMRNVDAGIND